MNSTKTERFKTGWKKLKEIDGEAGEKVIESLKDISPDLGTFIIEYAFRLTFYLKPLFMMLKRGGLGETHNFLFLWITLVFLKRMG